MENGNGSHQNKILQTPPPERRTGRYKGVSESPGKCLGIAVLESRMLKTAAETLPISYFLQPYFQLQTTLPRLPWNIRGPVRYCVRKSQKPKI